MPQPSRPCDLPNQEKAAELEAQSDLTVPLAGDDWIRLQTQDAAAYNQLFPRYNANIDFARDKCIAKQSPPAPAK